MKYAVIATGGKQYKVTEGDVLEVERLASNGKNSISFSEVLLSVNEGAVEIGKPYIAGMSVIAEVIGDVKGQKIRVSKFKAKARYRRTTGHRQSLTQIKITQIGSEKAKTPVVAEKAAEKAPKVVANVTPKSTKPETKKK